MILLQGQIGGFKMEKSMLWSSNSFLYPCRDQGFLIFQKFTCSVALNSRQFGQIRTINPVKASDKLTISVSDRGSENPFINEVIETEFKFEPTFGEYVKAMESIKTLRDKSPSKEKIDEDNNESLHKRFSKTNKEHENKLRRSPAQERNVRFAEKRESRMHKDGDMSRASRFEKYVNSSEDRSEEFFQKDNTITKRNHELNYRAKDGNSMKGKRLCLYKSSSSVKGVHTLVVQKGKKLDLTHKADKNASNGIYNPKNLEYQGNNRKNNVAQKSIESHIAGERNLKYLEFIEEVNRKVLHGNGKQVDNKDTIVEKNADDFFHYKNGTEREIFQNGNQIKKYGLDTTEIMNENKVSKGRITLYDSNVVMAEKNNDKLSKMTVISGNITSQVQGLKKDDVEDSEFEMERAAFKTFEVFTDVKNRPRVLRMELEERLHKLAKWLNGTDINLPEWQFSKMLHSAKIKFTDHSILRLIQMLGELGNWRRVLQLLEWIQSRERFKSYKSRYIFTTALNVLRKSNRPVEALNVFYAMRQQLSSYPDLAAYHCIAVALGQAGHIKELFDVIDCMRALPHKKFKLGLLEKWDPRLEPDTVVYNTVLNACFHQKQWEGAFWVLQELKQKGIRPSSATYGLVMKVMFACEKYNLVHEFFVKAEKSGPPNALSYKVLVDTLWMEGRIDDAVLTVQNMEKRGVVGEASLYYDLARCLCSAGRCQEALMQVKKICNVAKKPLVVTYTGLIQTCIESGSMENAEYIFDQMHGFCSPNTVTCNIMLKSYIKNEMPDRAIHLFYKMLDGQNNMRSHVDNARKIVPDKFTFDTVLGACATGKMWDDFEKVYLQMLLHGFHYDNKRHSRMILEASRTGKGNLLDAIWKDLILTGSCPPSPIVKQRFFIKLQEGNCAEAISCIQSFQANSLNAFFQKEFLNYIKQNVGLFCKDTLFNLIHELNSLNSGNNQLATTYQNIVTFCQETVDEHALIALDSSKKPSVLSSEVVS